MQSCISHCSHVQSQSLLHSEYWLSHISYTTCEVSIDVNIFLWNTHFDLKLIITGFLPKSLQSQWKYL
jgi:hypothetical protein